MNGTEIAIFANPAKERANRRIFGGLRNPKLYRYDLTKIFGLEIDSRYNFSLAGPNRKKLQDVCSLVYHPGIKVNCRGRNTVAKDLAAKATLLTSTSIVLRVCGCHNHCSWYV
jgi:hypothetical protein